MKKKMEVYYNNVNVLFLCILVLVILLRARACVCFTSFVFGDSLVDAGNNNYIFTLSKANSPPYGIDFKPSGGRPTGRFTNGRTIPDIVGETLGGQSFPPPYLAPNTQADDALHRGINYASGASGILDETGSLFIGRIPLRQQVKYFEESRSYMKKIMGENGSNELLKKAIFSLTIGSNDVLSYVQPPIPFLGHDHNVSPTMLQDFMVSNFTVHLRRLHELGARKFIVVGVGPLGCIPYVRALRLIPSGKCSDEVNDLVQGYNIKLKNTLRQLNQELGPKSIFVYANSYDIFTRIIMSYRRYEFENANGPCCGGHFLPFICLKNDEDHNNNNNNTMSSYVNLCQDRSKYVFWDAYHPTEAANLVIAKELMDGDDTNITFPFNIRHLYNYNTFH